MSHNRSSSRGSGRSHSGRSYSRGSGRNYSGRSYSGRSQSGRSYSGRTSNYGNYGRNYSRRDRVNTQLRLNDYSNGPSYSTNDYYYYPYYYDTYPAYETVYTTPVFLSNGSMGYIPKEYSIEEDMKEKEMNANAKAKTNKKPVITIDQQHLAEEARIAFNRIRRNVMQVANTRNKGPMIFGMSMGTLLSIIAVVILLAFILQAVIPVVIAIIIIIVLFRLFG